MCALIEQAIELGAILSVSVSGGKDSQAMLSLIRASYPHVPQRLVHADLGRAEWPQTPGFIGELSRQHNHTIEIVRRVKGDLVQRIEERLNSVSTDDPTRPAKPFWPSAQQRYCTSDLKRGPIQKQQRTYCQEGIIVSCVGFRADESAARRKRPVLSVERAISSKKYKDLTPAEALSSYDGGRLVLTWLPIHEWPVGRVWEQIGTTDTELHRRQALYRSGDGDAAIEGWPAHVAYVYGNDRLSCALCVLASLSDLCNGKKHHPELYRRYVELEQRSGYTFRDGFSLASI